MNNEYLLKEYELCFEQLRYYDTRQDNILKFLFSMTSAVATAEFAVYKISQGLTSNFYSCHIFLSSIVFIATVLLYVSLLQNRLYFVYIARQLNAIRRFLMATEANEFKENQLYTATNISAIKPVSIHTLQFLGTALLSSMFGGVIYYSLYGDFWGEYKYIVAIVVTVFIVLIEIGGGYKYLIKSNTMSADEIIHGLSKNKDLCNK